MRPAPRASACRSTVFGEFLDFQRRHLRSATSDGDRVPGRERRGGPGRGRPSRSPKAEPETANGCLGAGLPWRGDGGADDPRPRRQLSCRGPRSRRPGGARREAQQPASGACGRVLRGPASRPWWTPSSLPDLEGRERAPEGAVQWDGFLWVKGCGRGGQEQPPRAVEGEPSRAPLLVSAVSVCNASPTSLLARGCAVR